MTLEELETEKIRFGESKKGVTFKEAFNDAGWTELILTRFEKSEKPEHMMYVRYVARRMKQDHNKVKASTKATSGRVPVPFDVWTEIQDPENNMGSMRPSLSHPSGIQEDMGLLRQENQNLAHGAP